jgi:lipopolysaccharide transport system ATP-binding protein
MSEFAIRAEGLGKRYRRGLHLEPYRTIRDAITNVARKPFGGGTARDRDSGWFWALQDASFELSEGETLGIIGPNGAGKTTLLKILARVTTPTSGQAIVRGRLGTLLEVGTGFHLELTGRENIKLNGAILGMSRRQIADRMDEIIDFAGVEEFADTPVKRYSSGMFMRLAFSVAAHLEPDILIVDEVLAVGDAAFQQKCLGKLGEVGREGRTVVFVSHNIASVKQICTRGILLEHGRIVRDGEIDDVADAYVSEYASAGAEIEFEPEPEKAASFLRLTSKSVDGRPSAVFGNIDPIVLEAEFAFRETLRDEHVWIRLYDASGLLLVFGTDEDDGAIVPVEREPGRYVARFTLPGCLLNEGNYRFRVQIVRRTGIREWAVQDDRRSAFFTVEDTTDFGDAILGKRKGVLRLALDHEERRLPD